MNWIIFLKSLSIIFATTVLLSTIFTGIWLCIHQKTDNTSELSTPDSNTTDRIEAKKEFSMVLNNKNEDYKNVLRKSNERNNTYGINSTWIKYDENSNENLKNENTNFTVKSVPTKNTTVTIMNTKIQDQIGDLKIKEEMIPEILNRNVFNVDKSTNNFEEELKSDKIVITNNSLQASEENRFSKNKTIVFDKEDNFYALELAELFSNGSDSSKKSIDELGAESIQQITVSKEEISEETTSKIEMTKSTESSINDREIIEINVNKSENNSVKTTTPLILTTDEEIIRGKEDDDVIKEKSKLLNSEDMSSEEINLDLRNDEQDLLSAESTIFETTEVANSHEAAMDIPGIVDLNQNLSVTLNTSEEFMVGQIENNTSAEKIEFFNNSNDTENLDADNYNLDLHPDLNVDRVIKTEENSNDNATTENVEYLGNDKNDGSNFNNSEVDIKKTTMLLASSVIEEISTDFGTMEDNGSFINANNGDYKSFEKLNNTDNKETVSLFLDEEVAFIVKNTHNDKAYDKVKVFSNKTNLTSEFGINEITTTDDTLNLEKIVLLENNEKINSTSLSIDDFKPNIPFKINFNEEIITGTNHTDNHTGEQTSLLVNGKSISVTSSIYSVEIETSPAPIAEDEKIAVETNNYTTEEIELSTIREETITVMAEEETTIAQVIDIPIDDDSDTSDSSQIQKYEPSYSSTESISLETEIHDNLETFTDISKVTSTNKSQNIDDLEKLEVPNSTFNFTKDIKSKDLIIITPSTVDSEAINNQDNEKIKTVPSYNVNSSASHFNDRSDRIIIVTPTILGEDNIFNGSSQDQSTDMGMKLTFDLNSKNFTNSDRNELMSTEISSTTNVAIKGEVNRRCYGELGCLTRQRYGTLFQYRNLFPSPRETINTSVIIYTRDDPIKGQVIIVSKIKSVERINLNPKRKTKFIIHGFNSSPQVAWVKEMTNEFLQHDDFNVIVVDWTRGSSLSIFYSQAAENARLVGWEIAYMIKHLHIKYGLKLEDIHLVGHSLGAHVAGYAGEKMHGKIGRISGLDPAYLNFEKMPSNVRLDFTDAKLVDVIHTDSQKIIRLGIRHPCGHLDFYPNSGDDQPGCSVSLSFEEVCDHNRAIKFFTESINSKCKFIAHECINYENFMAGDCFLCNSSNSLNCGIMGYHADKSPALLPRKLLAAKESNISEFQSKFFISTGDKDPYCRKHYRITIDLANPPEAQTSLQGFLNVTIHADNGVIRNMELTPNGNRIPLSHGATKQIVALPPKNAEYSIGRIWKVELFWTCSNTWVYLCFLGNDKLFVDNIVVDILELSSERKKREIEFSSKLCSIQGPQEYTGIISGSSAPFVDNCNS